MNTPARLMVPVSPADHAQGDEDAVVTLVEYGDYQCPYCAAAYPIVKQLQRQFGGELRFVFRNFPLTESHALAQMAAEIAEAAAALQNFWPMHDWIYENQPRWTRSGARELLLGIEAVGLDAGDFERALKQPQIAERIRADYRGGVRSGVDGTPGFFINGAYHRDSPKSLARVIEKVLGREKIGMAR